ncbi:MAG: 5-formyltetrahydrofolate cyclo-ligase [Oscillospiraceae bacterium]|nr:5-formyltetrahydrofolate cyclo-ligase [Oscillospiraceae bacterium]
MTDISKDEIRAAIKAKRRALSDIDIKTKSKRITDNLLSLSCFSEAVTVMTYLSAFKEPDTSEIIDYLYKSGRKIVVPISNTADYTITPSYLPSPDNLVRGAYGISEPSECIIADINDIDIALIPGIAFDLRGMRVGFGKGYYDRFLERFEGIKIGMCYDFQMLKFVPASEHDVKMDIIITEKRIYNDF